MASRTSLSRILTSVPSPPDPVAFSLFGLEIRWYALFMLAGIIAGFTLARALAARLGLDADWTLDVAPWIVLFSILGARSIMSLSAPNTSCPTRGTPSISARAVSPSTVASWPAPSPSPSSAGATGNPSSPGPTPRSPASPWPRPSAAGATGPTRRRSVCRRPCRGACGSTSTTARRSSWPSSDSTRPFSTNRSSTSPTPCSSPGSRCASPARTFLRHGDVFAVYLVTYGVARFLIERIRTDSLYIGPLPAAFWLSGLLVAERRRPVCVA